jgi:hypothetical protein
MTAPSVFTSRWEGHPVSKQLVAQPGKSAIQTVLLLAGSLVLLSACATVPQPNASQAAVPSSSQAADGPQTGAWSMP